METDSDVLKKWEDFKALVEELDFDVQKNCRGVAAAGVRVRKGLRTLKTKAAELVKQTVQSDKEKKAARPKKEKKEKKAKAPKAEALQVPRCS